MRKRFDLSDYEWTLTGWQPWYWRFRQSMELGNDLGANIAPVKVKLPCSVQQAMLNAGVVADWNYGINSFLCVWIENRHWVFSLEVPADCMGEGQPVLVCEGLDYEGYIRVNGVEISQFKGTHLQWEFDLTGHLKPGERNFIDIVFTWLPRYLGQIGYTSEFKDWKPRFNYIWDWVPRVVSVGVYQKVHLEWRKGDAIKALSMYEDYSTDTKTGSVNLRADLDLDKCGTVQVLVENLEGGVLGQYSFKAEKDFKGTIKDIKVAPWCPNGQGEQPLYNIRFKLISPQGKSLDEIVRRVGFRQIKWLACEGAPKDAEPWICEANGTAFFLQGANWVPPVANFADVTEEQYTTLLKLYKELGFNLLRVWGGAILERERFYELCDELGLLVWQEFCLSSSGIDNYAPDDKQSIAEMKEIVTSYIDRRQHHPSLLMWCGGNELQTGMNGEKAGQGLPLDTRHPMLKMMSQVCAKLDPTRKFVATSSTGPRFFAQPEDFGKGLHHDVHGPWNLIGHTVEWIRDEYWAKDDSLFRSETGMPGAAPIELIKQYGGSLATPISERNPFWNHTGGWWIERQAFLDETGADENDLEAYVKWSQPRQAEVLRIAATACKKRFPACGGFMIWEGHDCYPCPANCAVIDFHRQPKPAALALGKVFHTPQEELGDL